MATKIIHKKSSVAAKVPLASDLEVGEIALNLADLKIFSKQTDGTVVELGAGDVSQADVTAHEAALSIGYSQLTSVPSTFAPSAHTHTKSQITDFSDGDYATAAQGTTADNAMPRAGGTFTGTVNVTTIDFGDWTVTESGGHLYFAVSGVNKMKLDASGNLQVAGDIDSNATIT